MGSLVAESYLRFGEWSEVASVMTGKNDEPNPAYLHSPERHLTNPTV